MAFAESQGHAIGCPSLLGDALHVMLYHKQRPASAETSVWMPMGSDAATAVMNVVHGCVIHLSITSASLGTTLLDQ